MEGDLHMKVVKNGPFNEDEGRAVFVQIVAAIKHMVSCECVGLVVPELIEVALLCS